VPFSVKAGGGIIGVESPAGRPRGPCERRQTTEADYRTGEGGVAQALAGKPALVSFTENGTDPGCLGEGWMGTVPHKALCSRSVGI
jgi:hypothetical protein